MTDSSRTGRDRLINVLLWVLVLVPIAGGVHLVRKHSVDQRFLDDWAWAQDAVKYVAGPASSATSLIHDLFSVHLEHRPAVPRILAMLVTVWARGDVQAQNVLTFLFVTTSFAALCWLWLRRGSSTIRDAWLPLLLAAGLMFSPVQWQMLLWPVCVGTVLPTTWLMLSFCVAFTSWPWWARCLAGAGLAILGLLSFASGVLVWVLPLPVFLLCGAFASNRQRAAFALLWGAVLALTLFFYFQVQVVPRGQITEKQTHLLNLPGNRDLIYDLHNEAQPQYAYHQGETNTMRGALPYFLSHPGEDLRFVAVFSGALTSRGWAAHTVRAATIVGSFFLAGLVLLAWSCWHFRREPAMLARLLPMLCLGAYTPITGLMVAVGRIHAGHLGTALNTRYHAHQTQIVVALVGAAFFLGRHLLRDRQASAWRRLAWLGAGALAGIVGVGWIFGASMMEAWQAARFRNAAAQLVSQIFPEYSHYVAWVAGNHLIARDLTDALDQQGLIRRRPLRDNRLSTLTARMRISERALAPDRTSIRHLTKDAAGNWSIDGYAALPVSQRPADGLLLAYRIPGGEWRIWGFTQANGAPPYLARSLGKDMWGIVPGRDPWPARLMCALENDVAICEQPPPGAQISAWVMDMRINAIFRVTRSDKGRPDEDGLTAEEFARVFEPQP